MSYQNLKQNLLASQNMPVPSTSSVVIESENLSVEEIEQKFKDILDDDHIVLHARKLVNQSVKFLSDKKAFFKHKDVIRRALNRSQKEIVESILEKKEFEDLVTWIVTSFPFVKIGETGYITTQEMWDDEQKILKYAKETNEVYQQPEKVVEEAIQRKKGISQEQIDAVYAACLSDRRVTIIEGTAGSGKSFTMEAVKETYMEMGYHVMGTALGWAAAKVLVESAKLEDENCRAIEGLTRSWLSARANGVDPFPGPTLVIVDEAGMVGTKHMSIILEETARSQYPVKVVLTGDSLQVVPVKAGNSLELIKNFYGTTRISTIRRQYQYSHRNAVKRFSEQQSGYALHTFLHQESLHWCQDKDMLMNMLVQHYVSYRIAFPEKKAIVITLSNKDVLELNFRIRAAYKKLGLIGKDDIRLKVNNGIDIFETDFSVGDEVILRSNDKNLIVYESDSKKNPLKEKTWKAKRLGVFNRNAGRIVAIRRSKNPIGSYDFVIDLSGDNPGRVVINSDKFKNPDKEGMPMIHNYAGTIYGSQGQTVSKVFLVDNERMDFRLAYVGMSRHKENVDVYLDETDLHRRLDNIVGKRQSLESRLKMERQQKKMDDVHVKTGRYTRTEMLQCVSLCWGKHSENLTCVVFEEMRRLGKERMDLDAEKRAKIQSFNQTEPYTDFIPEFNQPYRLVNIEKILKLPDPIEESELIRPSDVEENKKKFQAQEMPIDIEKTPIPQSENKAPQRKNIGSLPVEEEKTFFGKAFGWILKNDSADKDEFTPEKIPLRHHVKSAFVDVDGVDEEEDNDPPELLAKLNAWLNPKAKIDIPYVEHILCGQVIYPEHDKTSQEYQQMYKNLCEKGIADPCLHYIDWTGVPSVLNVEGEPDKEWIANQKDKLWAIGKYGEPRILALDPYGNVSARYRFNGDCVVGEGHPPICINPKGSKNSQVYIVAGAKEWLWLRETLEKKYINIPQKIPHIIWAAKDMDWSFIASSLKFSEKIVIVRSKSDDRQIPWALDLQNYLQKKYHLSTHISPEIPAIKNKISSVGHK